MMRHPFKLMDVPFSPPRLKEALSSISPSPAGMDSAILNTGEHDKLWQRFEGTVRVRGKLGNDEVAL